MESKDLRLGNYVKQGVVDNIGLTLIIANNRLHELSVVEPVELNEEWLLRFGFQKIEYSDERHGFGDEYHLKVNEDIFFNYSDDFSLAIYRNEEAIEDEIGILPKWEVTKYVNGLQNLYYSLTGEEIILKDK